MSINGKELDEIYQRQYAGGFEEGRLTYTKANETEFILTIHYIHKFLQKGARVIDIGAGCGAYTKAISEEGYFVDTIDLHEDNVSRMRELFKDSENVNVYQGNALDLHEFPDDSYDLVLLMGPVYHLHKYEDRVAAIKEAARVAKKGAPIFVAFVLQDAPLIEYIFQSENPAEEINEIGYIRETAQVTENTGSSIFLHTIATIDELTDKVCESIPVTKGPRFAQDGLSQVIREAVNNMSEASYNEWIQYLIATAERPDLMGYSNHVVQTFIKK
ncbi:class I SAM-dependent methyltransferase [Butyrivibrio sp. MB2005]|uniref:class I SAM-dependent methyltransferase n=1 Tax=Butyrivibrio sp. MB2005 TaxID=1280678 RepID=UPI00040427C7|nr:class I SAM-dependent methyltransferase [Butyrivibrio sp. MB2005]